MWTNSNWFTIQFISLTRLTKEPLGGFQLSWTIVQMKDFLPEAEYPSATARKKNQFGCKTDGDDLNGTSFYIHRSLVCDGYVHCQPISNEDELASICPPTNHSMTDLLSSSMKSIFRKHFIFIFVVSSVVLLLICLTSICVIIIQRQKQRRILSERNSSHDEDENAEEEEGEEEDEETKDFLSSHRYDQAVTTV